MLAASAVLLAALGITTCLSLQFPYPSSERVPAAPGSPRSQGEALENTIVIQSKAYNVTNRSQEAQVKKNVYVKVEDSEENLTEPKLPQYAIDCGDDKACLEAHGMDVPTFRPYTQEELERFLSQYAASHGKDGESASNKLANLYMDEEEAVINVLESNPKSNTDDKSKSASWHLLQAQKHNHPYDDRKGWVTLEPVPWAQSQIQKWEPNAKPQIPTWDPPHHRPSSHWEAPGSSPHHDHDHEHDHSTERPWAKPSYEYKPRPQWGEWTRPSDFPERPPPGWGANPDIITDNRPGYFPGTHPSQRPWYDQEPYSSRPQPVYEHRPSPLHPPTHPAEGDGQWVLLSSTKGYSLAHRHRGGHQRALTFDTKSPTHTASMSSHRTVRLTVLPADDSTNTTLSHGGLLEVESSQQTVDEAQREHAAKMLKLNTITSEQVKATPAPSTSRRSADEIRVFSASPQVQSKTAVLAAVGAGMIPATMAMLLPMVLGRRRRSTEVEGSRNRTLELERVLLRGRQRY